ncbi:CoA-binding protein [Novispirillum sp. DQ9]|uniref:CoA-binding protein n=1 Tax=Novispirillum sp. DQ9 TaxID=3398612 RepID=UPI003C7A4E7A
MAEFRHTPEAVGDGGPIPYPDDYLRGCLHDTFKVAVIGFKVGEASERAALDLRHEGFRVIPVNPDLAGELHLGEVVPGRVADIPTTIDMILVYGTAKDAEMAAEGARHAKGPFDLKVLWFAPGARNDDAARAAEAAGLRVVQEREPADEARRLHVSH